MLLNFRAVWSRGAVWPSTRPCQGRDRRFESGRDRHLTCPRLERWPSPVEGDGLENRYRGNPIVGSNPTLSAKLVFESAPDGLQAAVPDVPSGSRRVAFVLHRLSALAASRARRAI